MLQKALSNYNMLAAAKKNTVNAIHYKKMQEVDLQETKCHIFLSVLHILVCLSVRSFITLYGFITLNIKTT